jgi:hypothetical protein
MEHSQNQTHIMYYRASGQIHSSSSADYSLCVCVHTQHPSYIFHVSAADVSDLVCTYLLNATLNFKSDAYVP